jgi:hypothetical protein
MRMNILALKFAHTLGLGRRAHVVLDGPACWVDPPFIFSIRSKGN